LKAPVQLCFIDPYIAWRKALFSAIPLADPDFIAFAAASAATLLLGVVVFKLGYNHVYRRGLLL
ncbi:MAG: hypothetical protein DRJ96_08215, partial [Thermoprotei archaeon]